MLPQELIKEIKRIELRARFMASEVLSGEYESTFKGQGMEFDEVREYVPGDEVRMIDWNVTARMNRPFVKVFKEEREMTIMILVDVSRSLLMGSSGKTKQRSAAELAALMALLATRNNDRVGLLTFGSAVETFIPPQKGRGHVWRIIRTILKPQADGSRTSNLGEALQHAQRVLKRRATVIVISDFFVDSFRARLLPLAKQHDVLLARMVDPWELASSGRGLVSVQDLESNALSQVDRIYEKGHAMPPHERAMQNWLKNETKGTRADVVNFRCDESVVVPLERYMRLGARAGG